MILNITPEEKIKYFKNNLKEGIIYKIVALLILKRDIILI